jgi:hypothetical protein
VDGLVYSSGSEYGICIAVTIIIAAIAGGLIGAWYGSSEASWRNTGLDLLLSTVLGGIGGVLAIPAIIVVIILAMLGVF